jgi:hypothetical protein
MAGFGTAGSLLACAAVLFVIATGVVAFQGWPGLANPTTPASVRLDVPSGAAGGASAPPRPAAARVTIARLPTRPVFASAPGQPTALAPAAGRPHPAPNSVVTAPGGGSAPVVGTGGANGTGGATVINLHGTSDTGGVGAAGGKVAIPKPRQVVSQNTVRAGQPVSKLGSAAGSAPGSVSGSADGSVFGSAAGGSVGRTVGNTVKGVAGTAGQAVTRVGAGAAGVLPGG